MAIENTGFVRSKEAKIVKHVWLPMPTKRSSFAETNSTVTNQSIRRRMPKQIDHILVDC